MKLNLHVWRQFLTHPSIFCRQFIDFDLKNCNEMVDLYTDASHNFNLGCGGVSDKEWYFIAWEPEFMLRTQPSIEYLELYAVAVGVVAWIPKYSNMSIYLFCDNQSVVHMINNCSSSCKNCMILIRIIVLQGLLHNTRIRAKYVPSKLNSRSDALSRKKFSLFRCLTNYSVNPDPIDIPNELWPMSKVWNFN